MHWRLVLNKMNTLPCLFLLLPIQPEVWTAYKIFLYGYAAPQLSLAHITQTLGLTLLKVTQSITVQLLKYPEICADTDLSSTVKKMLSGEGSKSNFFIDFYDTLSQALPSSDLPINVSNIINFFEHCKQWCNGWWFFSRNLEFCGGISGSRWSSLIRRIWTLAELRVPEVL